MQIQKSNLEFKSTSSRNQAVVGLVMVLMFGALGGGLLSQQNESVSALVLIKDIPSGTRINSADVRTIQISGDAIEAVLPQLPPRAITTRALQAGALLQVGDLDGAETPAAVISFELAASALPALLRVGDTVQLWQVIPAERANQLGLAEIIEIADTRYDASKKISLRIQPGLLPAVFIAGESLQIVRIT